MLLSIGLGNFLLFCLFVYLLLKKHTVTNFISIILLLFIIPSILDKLIGTVELGYGYEYTQFSFIDLIIWFYIFKSFDFKISKNIFFINIIFFIIFYFAIIINIFETDSIKTLVVYSYNYIRIGLFILFSYIYLKKCDFSSSQNLNKITPIHLFLFLILLLEGLAFQVIMGTDRLALPHLNVNVLPNALVLFYLILYILKRTNNYYFLLFVILVLFTESRTGLLLLFLIKFFIEENITFKRILLASVALAILVVSNDRISELFLNIDNFEKIDTIRSRLQIWYGTFNLLENNYLFGIGPGLLYVHEDWLTYLFNTFQHRELLLSVHNEFIQQTLFVGIFFSTIFFLLIMYIFIKNGKSKLLVPVVIMFMINSNIDTIRFDMIFGILLGSIIYLNKRGLVENSNFRN